MTFFHLTNFQGCYDKKPRNLNIVINVHHLKNVAIIIIIISSNSSSNNDDMICAS